MQQIRRHMTLGPVFRKPMHRGVEAAHRQITARPQTSKPLGIPEHSIRKRHLTLDLRKASIGICKRQEITYIEHARYMRFKYRSVNGLFTDKTHWRASGMITAWT